MVQKLRTILVNDILILSVLNGSLLMSKQGPKSAEYQRKGFVVSKSKIAGVYVKHMVSEIVLLVSCNKDLIS